MVISPELRMGQNRDDNHRENVPNFIIWTYIIKVFTWAHKCFFQNQFFRFDFGASFFLVNNNFINFFFGLIFFWSSWCGSDNLFFWFVISVRYLAHFGGEIFTKIVTILLKNGLKNVLYKNCPTFIADRIARWPFDLTNFKTSLSWTSSLSILVEERSTSSSISFSWLKFGHFIVPHTKKRHK